MHATYRGRFAPSPTGPLHFGSLVAALGSYLDARHQHGTWLVRIEDVDTTRTIPGTADDILRTLEQFGLHWDEGITYQSQRSPAYDNALHALQLTGAAYPCACTRKEIADSALHLSTPKNTDELVYPGTCRNGIPGGRIGRAWRVRTDNEAIHFTDKLQGLITQYLEQEAGDFVIKRADGLYAYQLAVVVDDAWQRISHVVRGYDLLGSTARQIHLQRLLKLETPDYLHLPIAINAQGEKLSKQTLATPLDRRNPSLALLNALKFLQQNPPTMLENEDPASILHWGVTNWNKDLLKDIRELQQQ